MNSIAHRSPSVVIGHRAPNFALPDVTGRTVALDDVLGAGPVVVWYSNGNGQARLTQLRQLERQFDARGARVVVIAPKSRAETDRLAAAVGGDFIFLADEDGSAARDFGASGADGVHASAFLLDRSGAVRWRFVARGTTKQPRPSKVLGALTSSTGLPIPGPSSVLTPPAALITLAIVAALGVLARFADHALLSWDEPVRDAVLGFGAGAVRTAMKVMSELGDRYALVPLTVVLAGAVWRRCRQMAAVFLAALPLGLAIEFLIKFAVARPRPSGVGGLNSSFPSGHVVAGVVFWGLIPPLVFILTARLWAWRVSIVLVSVIVAGIGMSRVYLGAHWPSDVLGGYLAGALVLLGMEWFLRSRVLECDGCALHPLRYGRRQ